MTTVERVADTKKMDPVPAEMEGAARLVADVNVDVDMDVAEVEVEVVEGEVLEDEVVNVEVVEVEVVEMEGAAAPKAPDGASSAVVVVASGGGGGRNVVVVGDGLSTSESLSSPKLTLSGDDRAPSTSSSSRTRTRR